MKKTVLSILVLFFAVAMYGQENQRQKEFGLIFSNFNSFGISYKVGTNTSLWRFNTIVMESQKRINKQDSNQVTTQSSNFNLLIGKELRRDISDNIEFRYGADVKLGYNKASVEKIKQPGDIEMNSAYQINYTIGLNLVVGFNYLFNDAFALGVEILPYFDYSILVADNSNNNSIYNWGLNNNSAMISFSYRF